MSKSFKDTFLSRISTCKGCPDFLKILQACKKCGCIVPAKAAIPASTCPAGKWDLPQPDIQVVPVEP